MGYGANRSMVWNLESNRFVITGDVMVDVTRLNSVRYQKC